MNSLLTLRIQQLYAAFGDVAERPLSEVRFETGFTDAQPFAHVHFGTDHSPAQLHNIAFLLVANIARIRDLLKKWCQVNSVRFRGDDLIRDNADVAIVHDLCNSEKHFGLDRPPRSGRIPELQNLHKQLVLTKGPNSSMACVRFELTNGQTALTSPSGGAVALVITGDVIDETGLRLGDFAQICGRAIAAWETLLEASGVIAPLRHCATGRKTEQPLSRKSL